MKKLTHKKSVKLENTFLPKRKRVLNKRALPVLIKPETKPAKRQKPEVDGNVLNSQCSISSCFLDSQGNGPSPTPPNFAVRSHNIHAIFLVTHACLYCLFQARGQSSPSSPTLDMTRFSQLSLPFTQSPVKQSARTPGKCTHAYHMDKVVLQSLQEAVDLTCITSHTHARTHARTHAPLRHRSDTHHITHSHTHPHTLQPKCFLWLRLCYKT